MNTTFGDSTTGGVYYGTVSVGNATNEQYLNIYGNPGSETYYGFDSNSNALEVIYYLGSPETMIQNWNPVAPDPMMFSPPTMCYPLPQMMGSNRPMNPLAGAPVFPKGFTMYIFDGYDEYTIYSDSANLMWRVDSAATTLIQKANVIYTFTNVDYISSAITPLPCYQYPSPYTFITELPPAFTAYLGNATYNGMPLTVWSGMGQIWYWDTTNTPQFFLNGPSPSVVTFFQPMTPPSVIFDPPTLCLPGISQSSPSKLLTRNSPYNGLLKLNKH
jgi:hypothetical protein